MLAGCVKEGNLLRPYKSLLHKNSKLQDLAQEFELHLEMPENLYCDPNKGYKNL